MSMLSLIDSTGTAEMLSGGRFLKPSIRQWNRNKDSLTTTISSFDHFDDHLVNFQTRMHVTGNIDEPVPEAALKRLISVYVVQALEDEYVDDVYNNLVDCYVWSSKAHVVEPSPAEVRLLAGRKGLKIVDADPVIFEE